MGVVGTAWALDAVTGAPSYTGRVLRQTNAAALAGATTARPFGGVSGVRPGTSVTTVTSTSTTWTAQTFAGVIDLEASALSGAYEFAFNLVTSGSVTASNASNPRIDILSVRIDDPAEGDGTSVPAVTMVYTAGTAAASPTVPTTPARSFIVAQLQFPAGSGTTPTVTWVAPYTVAAGGIQPVPTSVGVTGTYVGQVVDDALLGYPVRWNGSAWVTLMGDTGWTAMTLLNSWVNFGGAYSTARYRRRNGMVEITGLVKSGTIAAGTIIATLPAGFRPATNTQRMFTAVSNNTFAVIEIQPSGNLIIDVCGSNAFLSLEGTFSAEQ